MRFPLLSITLLLSLNACSTEPKPQAPTITQTTPTATATKTISPLESSTGEPAIHAVQNTRLKEIMKELNALTYTQMLGEIDTSKPNQIRTKEIARIAGQLAANQKAVIATLPSLDLNPSEQSTFISLVHKLSSSAEQMQTLANQNNVQALPAAMDAVASTCTSCHTLFRKTPSILERCKDPKSTC